MVAIWLVIAAGRLLLQGCDLATFLDSKFIVLQTLPAYSKFMSVITHLYVYFDRQPEVDPMHWAEFTLSYRINNRIWIQWCR